MKRAAAKALMAASIAPAPRPETKPPATISGHHGVVAHDDGARRDEEASSSRAVGRRRVAPRTTPALKLETR